MTPSDQVFMFFKCLILPCAVYVIIAFLIMIYNDRKNKK